MFHHPSIFISMDNTYDTLHKILYLLIKNTFYLFIYFNLTFYSKHIIRTLTQFDVSALVSGGGLKGQSGALRLGIARALEAYSPLHRINLKPHGMMTRDSRVVESKKPGQPKARKKFQWVKR